MSKIEVTPLAVIRTAAELRRLPAVERDAILRAAADYDADPELTSFEAFDTAIQK